MLGDSRAFASFSVDDAGTARTFYEDVLGLDVEEGPMEGLLGVHLGSGATVMVYAKGDAHQPATFTVLHFAVEDLAATVDGLAAKGVSSRATRTWRTSTTAASIMPPTAGPTSRGSPTRRGTSWPSCPGTGSWASPPGRARPPRGAPRRGAG